MYRTHTCGKLRIENLNEEVTLCGWIQRIRNLGAVTFIDLRDRYGITQIITDQNSPDEVKSIINTLGREFVIQIVGVVAERSSKNPKILTGDIEILCKKITILNKSLTPPFTIEEESDGGDELRMRYRYLDLRRPPLQQNIALRHKITQAVRNYLSSIDFIEIETPALIKSTPEGARDFVVPSRMNLREFYALPQSPQQLKQLLMIAGYDRYFQIVKCFRDEDLRADRQPEFTQIDCEMAFVTQNDVLQTFEGLIHHLFTEIKNLNTGEFPRITYSEAMKKYGSDKPDIRFEMKLNDITNIAKGRDFSVFDTAEYIVAICVSGSSEYTRKQLDGLTEFVKRQQVGAKGLIFVRYNTDGTLKSSVDKFYSEDDLKKWAENCNAKPGDLLLIMSGEEIKTQTQMGLLRLEMARQLNLVKPDVFRPLWVVDFPLLEWDEETNRFHAMHHPFTSPKLEDMDMFATTPEKVRANAYDLVINGIEIGGGSVRIFNCDLQAKMFSLLGFTAEQAQSQFGFLMDAFKYGAPPHAGIAFGLDRLVSLFAGLDSIRDVIAFPKNNSGRDIMMDAPSQISAEQLKELGIME